MFQSPHPAHSPRLVSASDHAGGVSFAALVVRGVYKLEDVSGTKLEGGSGVQHRGLVDTLAVHQGVRVGPVGGDRHQPLAVHQVAVMREEARTKQLEQEVEYEAEERNGFMKEFTLKVPFYPLITWSIHVGK